MTTESLDVLAERIRKCAAQIEDDMTELFKRGWQVDVRFVHDNCGHQQIGWKFQTDIRKTEHL